MRLLRLLGALLVVLDPRGPPMQPAPFAVPHQEAFMKMKALCVALLAAEATAWNRGLKALHP